WRREYPCLCTGNHRTLHHQFAECRRHSLPGDSGGRSGSSDTDHGAVSSGQCAGAKLMSKRPPAPPPTIPEEMPPPRSRYNRPRRLFSVWGLVIGLFIGIGGGLTYAWVVSPVVEYSTAPYQLRPQDRAHYIVSITLAFNGDSNLNKAVERLLELQGGTVSGDIFQQVADAACRLASTGYVDSNSGLTAIRSMMTFYQLQGRSGCADTLLPVGEAESTPRVVIDAPTPTLPPPATKTPTPVSEVEFTPTPARIIVPTSVPQRAFVLANVSTF